MWGGVLGGVQLSAAFPFAEWLSPAAPPISEDLPERKALSRLRWGWNGFGGEGCGKGENRSGMPGPSPFRRGPPSFLLSSPFHLLSLVFYPTNKQQAKDAQVRSEIPR